MEAIAHFAGEHARVVEVKAADGDRVVEQHSMIGHVEDVRGDLPVLSEAVPAGDVEGGVHGEIGALVRSLA